MYISMSIQTRIVDLVEYLVHEFLFFFVLFLETICANKIWSEYMEEVLKKYWLLIGEWLQLLGDSQQDFESFFAQTICKQYSESHRSYHSLSHLYELLNYFEQNLCSHVQLSNTDKLILLLSIFFHDVVYDVGTNVTHGDNEKKSAQLFEQFFDQFVPTSFPNASFIRSSVTKYILQTISHFQCNSKEDPLLFYFLDLDLSILGAPVLRYQEYSQQIWKEYSHAYPRDVFVAKRLQFLQSVVDGNTKLYFTELFAQQWQAKAIQNLQWEISQLKKEQSDAQ